MRVGRLRREAREDVAAQMIAPAQRGAAASARVLDVRSDAECGDGWEGTGGWMMRPCQARCRWCVVVCLHRGYDLIGGLMSSVGMCMCVCLCL